MARDATGVAAAFAGHSKRRFLATIRALSTPL